MGPGVRSSHNYQLWLITTLRRSVSPQKRCTLKGSASGIATIYGMPTSARRYRQGGAPGFGLRRRLIDQSGEPKGELTPGEHKSIQTDRIILVPGPEDEIETVRWIYRTFAEEGKPEREIAHILNDRGIRTDLDRPWTRGTVHQILINEKYVGNSVWNHVSFKLKRKRVRNRPDMWIRADGAFEPIVDRLLFDAAQIIIQERSQRLSDDEMLERLRQLYEARGYLSGIVIDETENAPSSSAYQSRFGSLLRAYQLIGFTPDRDYRYIEINRSLRALYPEVLAEAIAGIESAGGTVSRAPATDILTINFEFTVSIVIARCRQTPAGSSRWVIRFDGGMRPDITIVIRMDETNSVRRDYYILPMLDISMPRVRMGEYNGVSLDAYRFETLEPLFLLAERVKLMEVA